ncbi:hypothetical protein ACQ4PT_037306 [Festuca glaucescens]
MWCVSFLLLVARLGTGWPPQMQFLFACTDGDLDRVKDAMDEVERESLASLRFTDFGPLHSAASSGDMAICRYLVEELGFDVNSDASGHGSGVTPLHCAVSHEEVTAVSYFLEKGADPNIKDSSNGTASLHEAAASGYDEITQLLLANGANVDEPSSHGTPLVAAAAHGKFSSMKILLEHHADVKTSEYPRKARLKSNGAKARLKSNGAKAVQENDYAAASKFYTEAIKLDPADAVLYSNRSLCHLKCDEAYDALHDANACIRLKPDWNKGYYRKGAALMSLLEYKEASDAFLAGVKLKPENKEMEEAYWEAVEAMRKEHSEPSLYDVD